MAAYICSAGDTWDAIAYKAYGDGLLYMPIMQANRDYAQILQFDGGEVLDVPQRVEDPLLAVEAPWAEGAPAIEIIKAPWE